MPDIVPEYLKPISEIEFVEQVVCDRYRIKIPKFMAERHGWWPTWEKERFRSMETNLKHGDVLYDVGACDGWNSAIFAQFVGGDSMCLFEPVNENWPNIKATWEANGLKRPMSCYLGFAANENSPPIESVVRNTWPTVAEEPYIIDVTKFDHLDEDWRKMPRTSLDRFCAVSGIIPAAITIDVEGAELIVLSGLEKVLRTVRPLLWVSLHENWVSRPGVTPKNQESLDFLEMAGYKCEFLEEDHEKHYFCRPEA